MNEKQKRTKQVKTYLTKMKNKGLDYLKATGGKDIDKIVANKRTYDNFIKLSKRIIERPKILAEVKEINKKIAKVGKENKLKKEEKIKTKLKNKILKESGKQIRDITLDKKTKSMLLNGREKDKLPHFKNYDKMSLKQLEKTYEDIHNGKSLKERINDIKNNEVDSFFDNYFLEIKNFANEKNKIKNLKNKFKENFADFHNFVDYVLAQVEFKEYADGYNKDSMKMDNAMGYADLMKNRLSMMERVATTKIYKR